MKQLATILLCWTVTATPVYTVDGDTFDASIPIWFGLTRYERIRVLGVDTPELKGATKAAALQSKAFADTWLKKGPVELYACELDSLRRVLAKVSRQGENLADLLIQAGLGSPR